MPVARTYGPDERPDIEVLIDGRWCKGELRQWSVDAEENWSAQVNWRRAVGETHIDTFAADRIRLDESPSHIGGKRRMFTPSHASASDMLALPEFLG